LPLLWETEDKEVAMNVRNCRKCGRLYNYVAGQRICPLCQERLEEDFQRVKEYVRKNPGVTVNRVAEECEVEISQIRQWLREERLELTAESGMILQCETCGTPIASGRFCEKCRRDLTKGLSDAIHPARKQEPLEEPKKDKGGDKMRFLNH